MLDMSKAFDTVNRSKLFKYLEKILLPEEIHLLHILTNDVFLKVKVENDFSREFMTLIGIMQGDCLSAILFIFYLAQALTVQERNDHNYAIESMSQVKWKHTEGENFTISPKYADDITYATTSENIIKTIKESVPPMLTKADLQVNHGKTEEYTIPLPERTNVLNEHSYSKHPETDLWKKCKLLGSFLDTITDIKNRRSLIITNMKNNRHVYASKYLTVSLKIRHFNCFETSIFLYNCALWTLTPSMINALDAFHRRQLRYALGIYYPKKISNAELYRRTRVRPWSVVVKERRLRFLGHVLRLNSDAPARQSLQEALKPAKRKQGRPKLTWIQQIRNDLKECGMNPDSDFQNVYQLASNRKEWRKAIVQYAIRRDSVGVEGSCSFKKSSSVFPSTTATQLV
jgi:hypothetical protein